MHTEFPTRPSALRLTAAALFAALACLGAAPAMAQTPTLSLMIKKTGATTVVKGPAGGRIATFEITLSNPGTADAPRVYMEDPLPGVGMINWGLASQTDRIGCSMEGAFPDQQWLVCDPGTMLASAPEEKVVVAGVSPDTCLTLKNTATATSTDDLGNQTSVNSNEAVVTITSDSCRPLFVIGDREPHAVNDLVNFWGAQWWKNNSMTGLVSNGVASFKGWASTSNIDCLPGATWATRPGNSSNPPATLPVGKDVMVIVTDTVQKVGPDIMGNIKEIVLVRSNLGYAPNPGHPGEGTVTEVVCPKP